MNAYRYTLKLANGDVVHGPIQGSGGVIDSRDRTRLEYAIRSANGDDTDGNGGLYEPLPGHVRMYPSYSAHGYGVPIDVNLRGASIITPMPSTWNHTTELGTPVYAIDDRQNSVSGVFSKRLPEGMVEILTKNGPRVFHARFVIPDPWHRLEDLP